MTSDGTQVQLTPGKSHNVSKPLMSDLVRLDSNDPLARSDSTLLGVKEVNRGATSDESPVLHGSGVKVRGDESVELFKMY